MSLTELKEAVVHLSIEERNELRDVIAALEEGVSLMELHAINQALDEAIQTGEPSIPAEQVWAEMNKLLSRKAEDAA